MNSSKPLRSFLSNFKSLDALSKLAYKGNYAFKRIFAEGIPREIIDKALKTRTTIQVSSEEFFIPWELLYNGPLGTQIDPAHFWGMQHIISRALIQEARPGDLESPIIMSLLPRIGLIVNSQLEHVAETEIPMFKNLHEKKQISLVTLRPLNANQRDGELEHIGFFLRDELHIIHLACHAFEKKPASQSCLSISDAFPITVEDFRVQEFEIKHHPLVILNACLTGTISPLYTSNWAAMFWERGARGVLATEFHVPDQFAALFTEQLYSRLLLSKPIGEALLETRHLFWKEQNNPLGLAYALYSSPSIQIVNPSRVEEIHPIQDTPRTEPSKI